MASAPVKNREYGESHPSEMGWPKTLGLLAQGRNINPETLLATDYLNHFNEVVMLIEMSADMPDCVEDVVCWEPISYEEHFLRSGFAAKELAVLAYENSPSKYREPFDMIVEQANRLAGEAATRLTEAIGDGKNFDPPVVAEMARKYTDTLRRLVDMASGIIHGHETQTDQSEIAAILAE